MQSFYLQNMYQRNLLKDSGGITLANVPIDLRRIDIPVYFLSTREDHIAPWRSTFAGTRLVSGPNRFVLGASGHIAGVINPPAAKKYGYWTSEKIPKDAEKWLESATYPRRVVVERLVEMDCRIRRRTDSGAPTGSWRSCGNRGRAGFLCQGAVEQRVHAMVFRKDYRKRPPSKCRQIM
jgi:hypothetical protein